jgi:hypothetical protein
MGRIQRHLPALVARSSWPCGVCWCNGDFATGIRKAAPAARPTANFRIATTHARVQVNATALTGLNPAFPVTGAG